MIPQFRQRDFTDEAVRNSVDHMLRLQQSYAMLPAVGVEEMIRTLAALCMTLDSVDDVLIHRVDWPMGSAGLDSFTAGADCFSERRNSLNPRGDSPEEKAVFSRGLAQAPRVEDVMAAPVPIHSNAFQLRFTS